MAPLGLVPAGTAVPELQANSALDLHLQFEETLASSRRMWLRGRLHGPTLPAPAARTKSRWWDWRSPRPVIPIAPQTAHLETRVAGHVLATDVPLGPDGRFEATFSVPLPVARRGWRIARNRLTWSGQAVEQCSLVLAPPEGARGVAVVFLPQAFPSAAQATERLKRSETASRLGAVLRQLQHDGHVLYYLASARRQAQQGPAALALAITSLGWPGGNFLLLPGEEQGLVPTFAAGLDRLRWLFAGSLDLAAMNLEPDLAAALPGQLEPKEDRAAVRRLVNPGDDPLDLLEGRSAVAVPREVSRLRPTRAGLVPRHPIVFCHGMLAFSSLHLQLPEDLNSFAPLREFLRERGFRALFPQVAPTSGVAARAGQLREQILRWTDEPVNLVAHSMGGLDARYLITHLGLAERVRSLTTIATPHRGTALADWFLANYRQRVPLLLALEALGINVDGFRDCCPAACREFNGRTPDAPGVYYFSFGGAVSPAHVTPVLRRAWNILAAVEGPNDGMVSAASARWGEYLGTLHVDHFAQTPDMTFVRPGENFDALGFYLRLLENLARRGL